MWALHKLRKLMSTYCGPLINVNALLSSPSSECPEPDIPRPFHLVNLGCALFIHLHSFYDTNTYAHTHMRAGIQAHMHSYKYSHRPSYQHRGMHTHTVMDVYTDFHTSLEVCINLQLDFPF